SNRPKGFKKCYNSILSQTYSNIRHLVSYDNEADKNYLNGILPSNLIKVYPLQNEPFNSELNGEYKFFPFNLYCNTLLKEVGKGWVIFLDDDNMLINDHVIEEIVEEIKKVNNNTLLIWRVMY